MYNKSFKKYLENINKIYKNNNPLFSVIIPLYNKEKYIKRAIDSVLKQTFQNFEIIVINDASTDSSLSVVKSIKDRRIKVFDRKRNMGQYFVRNYGIKKAKGKYIAFLDADDEYKNFFLMTIVDLMFKYQDIKIYATAFKKIYNYVTTKKTFYGKSKDCIINNFIEQIVKNENFSLQLSSMVVEKKLLFDVGLFYYPKKWKDVDITAEDFDLFVKLSMFYDKIAYSNKICSSYFRNTDCSVTRTVSRKKFRFDFVEKTLNEKKKMATTKEEKMITDELSYMFYESIILQLIIKKEFILAEKVLKKIPINRRKKEIIDMLKVKKIEYLLINNKKC